MELLAFLKQHTPGQYHADIETEFFDFREQENQMLPSNNAWNNTNDPLLFWRKVTSVSPCLGRIARRIWSVAANSVPSEQAFSTMNFLHSKLRNCLTPERANRLQYIYINRRALWRLDTWVLSTEELLQMGDKWIEQQSNTVATQQEEEENKEDDSVTVPLAEDAENITMIDIGRGNL